MKYKNPKPSKKSIKLWRPTPIDVTVRDIYHVYIIICLLNDKKYIGQTKQLEQRKQSHFSSSNSNPLMVEDINRFGLTYFEFHVLASTNDIEHAKRLESDNILKYNTLYPNGYNRTLSVANYHQPILTNPSINKFNSLDWLLCEDDLIKCRRKLIIEHIDDLTQLQHIPIINPVFLYKKLKKKCDMLLGVNQKHIKSVQKRYERKYMLYRDAWDVWNYINMFDEQSFTFDDYIRLREAFDMPYNPTNIHNPDYKIIPY